MSKIAFFILLISIIIAIIPLYYKLEEIKKFILYDRYDNNLKDKQKYILSKKNNTLEKEFINKYIVLKNELINYLNHHTYLKYEREAIEKIKELEKEKAFFEEFEKTINENNKKEFQEKELNNLTELIDRYILSEDN